MKNVPPFHPSKFLVGDGAENLIVGIWKGAKSRSSNRKTTPVFSQAADDTISMTITLSIFDMMNDDPKPNSIIAMVPLKLILMTFTTLTASLAMMMTLSPP